MKTIDDVQTDINECVAMSNEGMKKKELSALRKKVKFYNSAKAYLEFNPSLGTLKRYKAKLKKTIDECEANIIEKGIFLAKDKNVMRKESGATLAKEQLKVINYIS